jgi:predicted sugar kinase
MTKLKIPVGFVRAPLRSLGTQPQPIAKSINLAYPTRLEAMALDPSRIAIREDAVYTAGQINFKINTFRNVHISTTAHTGEVIVSAETSRASLVRHAVLLMRDALKFDHGISVDVDAEVDLRHCGFGSSSNTIASVAYAINELFGNPIERTELARYLAQNHGEESDDDEHSLVAVQCIGGSATAGIYDGAIIVLAGRQAVIQSAAIPDSYHIVAGVPRDFKHPDAEYLMNAELEAMPKFMHTGKTFGREIAYRLVHEAMPALTEGKLNAIGDLIFDYRFDMGSIENCSFVYPRMNDIAKGLRSLKETGTAEVLALSSVGPGFFAVTKDPDACRRAFEEYGMNTYTFKPYNGQYTFSVE